jgi:hyperosmotically inducible periplasmic protein
LASYIDPGTPQPAGRVTEAVFRFRSNLMFKQTQQLPPAANGAAVVDGAVANSSAVAPSKEVMEARQESQIWTAYALSPYLRASDLKVVVRDGNATLTGNVLEDTNRDLASKIALGVAGIRSVDNQIEIVSNYMALLSPGDRAFGELVDDTTVTSAVRSKLAWSRHADGLIADVSTSRGKVTVLGTATSEEAKSAASRLALSTHGVRSVSNQLVVETAKSGVVASIGNDIADSWITTKVKSTFMYSTRVSGADITVNTTAGVVTLTGKLESDTERALAIELAGDVRGVKSVDPSALTI